MLADEQRLTVQSGVIDQQVHLESTWRLTLLEFIADELPKWRNNPERPRDTAETSLTSWLCAHMNSATRRAGWDFLQFRIEEPDKIRRGRKIDLIPAPSAARIWIDGREYTEYTALIPIECKRLPTPKGRKRDEREYLYSKLSSTGGVQRFKAGHHGGAHLVGAMIGYIQDQNITFWQNQIRTWLTGLVDARTEGWTLSDSLNLLSHDESTGVAQLKSVHERNGYSCIQLRHIWIDMAVPEKSET